MFGNSYSYNQGMSVGVSANAGVEVTLAFGRRQMQVWQGCRYEMKWILTVGL